MKDQPKLHSLEELKASVNRSLTQIGFIPNLLLIHNPHVPAAGHLTEFWGWLEDLVEDGTLKGCSLGLSNFRPVDVEEIMRVARVKPVVNRESIHFSYATSVNKVEIEYHPYVMVHVAPLLDLHKKYNIITQAYGALAPTTGHPTGGPIIPVLERIAANLTKETGVEVDTSGVLMLWIMTQGGVCITSSGSEERIKKMSDLEKVRDLNDGELREIEEAGSRIHWRQRVSSDWQVCRCKLITSAGTSSH